MEAFAIIQSHEKKTIDTVEKIGRHIRIKFYDGTELTLLDEGCNTCGGYRVEGAE